MAKFQHTTRADFKTQFFNRIGDSSRTFWTDSEANLILNEALYTLGAVGQPWKKEVLINTAITEPFYDITADLASNQPLLALNLTFQTILDLINFHLIENISIATPTSEITNLTEILKFARNRVNQFQFQTGLILTKKTFNMNAPSNNRLQIDDEIIDIIRVAFIDFDPLYVPNLISTLNEEDEDSMGHINRNIFNTPSEIPTFYTSMLGNLNEIRIYPPPLNLGALEIISVNGFAAATVVDLTTKVGIPDNLVPYIKWGVLADIYWKDGVAYNPAMASYCEERWKEGILIGNNYSSIMEAKMNGIPILMDSVSSLDNSQSTWQNEIKAPSLIALLGYNLLATNCLPDNIYSLMFTAITNAYIPTDDLDYIDIKLEYIEPLLNYCVHLANVKSGFEAVKMTSAEKDDFLKMAINHNARLQKRGFNFEVMMKKVKRQEEDSSTRVKEEAA